MRLRLSRARTRAMGRRLQLLLALAVVATALGAVTASGASFVSESSSTVQASTSARSSDALVIVAGNNQTAVAGTAVPIAPSVRVVDGGGHPVSGLTVTFTPVTGGGLSTGGSVVTDDDGLAVVGELDARRCARPQHVAGRRAPAISGRR